MTYGERGKEGKRREGRLDTIKRKRRRRREMKNEKETKKRRTRNTFVATVRISMTDIAAIGMVVEKDNNYKETLGRLASEGLRIMGSIAKRIYPINTFEKAIKELRRMGYNDPLEKGTRYYDALYKELEMERTEIEKKKSVQSETDELVKKYNEQTTHRPDTKGQEEILNRHIAPESESSEIRKIKKGLAGAPPVAPYEYKAVN